jgi:outer membrane receptor protein involved in Fe transport
MRFTGGRAAYAALLASSALAAFPALAQETSPPAQVPETTGYGEIIVTAQKRSENLQDVPISIQALGSQKLEDLNVSDFKSYVQQLTSVTFQPSANAGGNPGQIVVYMRGVAAGGEGNHSGSLPAVGIYLDEQPLTSVGGNLDVHIYDIARIESLAGPQGTLYGASSEAGTIRVITNKPDTSGFAASFDSEVNKVEHGDWGTKQEGMVNVPLSSSAALRVVGFYQLDGGYIDNVPGTRCFLPQPGGICVNNNAFVKKNYNDTESWGGRAALKVDLDETWTVTPQVMYQELKSHGSYGYDPQVGDLEVQHFFPEFRNDKFIQAALTIEGKLGNWDVTYAGAYLDRKTSNSQDYTDYAESYDSMYSSVGGIAGYFYYKDALGNTIDPRQNVLSTDHFKKLSQELRVASPSSDPLRVVAGMFFQKQTNEIHQDYQVVGLDPLLSVNGHPGTLWLTQQHREDLDYAMFGEMSYDVTPTVTLTAGARAYIYDNSLIGFFGFGRNPGNGFSDSPPNAAGSNRTGVAQCFTEAGDRLYNRDTDTYSSSLVLLPPAVAGGPCTNLAVYVGGVGLEPVRAQGSGVTYRFNATWKPSDDAMLYATWSRGFRPGGINRRVDVPPYQADYLINYELGWKTTPLPGLHVNGAVYQQEWKQFQFSFLGANSFTEIHNGPDARIRGVELDVGYNTQNVALSFGAAYTDAKTKQNLCLFQDPTFTCADTGDGNIISAPAGTRLPITPMWKLNGTARYTVPVNSAKLYGQINASYQSSASSDIRTAIYQTFPTDPHIVINPAELLGRLEDFATINLALGADWEKFRIEAFISNLFDERGQIGRFQECGSCGQRPYIVPITPRTFGLRFGANF